MDEFNLYDGSTEYSMEYGGLDPAREVFKRDYPGAFFGQCIAPGDPEESMLVFDISPTNRELTLELQGKRILLGTIAALQNPLPTETTTTTPTETPTTTPTVTPTPLPSGKIIPKKISGETFNVRAGPGRIFAVAWKEKVDAERAYTLLGRSEDSKWLLIQNASNDQGWINADILQADMPIELLIISTAEFPTLTPTIRPTRSPTPTPPLSKSPPKGARCGQNSSRGICVGNIDYKNSVGYTSAGKNGRFIVMAVGVKNIGSFDISVNPFDFRLVMEDGRTYEHAAETYYYRNPLQATTLSPGNSAEGALVFLVPNDVGPAKLICNADFLDSDVVIDFHSNPEE